MPFTIECQLNAFPDMPFDTYSAIIETSFTIPVVGSAGRQRILEEIIGILEAYGISHRAFIAELKVMAAGELRRALTTRPVRWVWKPGTCVAACWPTFAKAFPVMAESLMVNFCFMLSASSCVEQLFTVANYQVVPNASHTTVQKNMSFFTNVRCDINQNRMFRPDWRAGVVQDKYGNDVREKRANRSKGDLHDYAQQLLHVSLRLLQLNGDALKSTRQLINIGKRKRDILSATPYALAEIDANARNPSQRAGSAVLGEFMVAHNIAVRTGLTALPVCEERQLANVAKTNRWNVAAIRKYLLQQRYTGQNAAQINAALLRSTKAPATKSLKDMLIEHWTVLELSVADANAVEPPAAAPAAPAVPAAPRAVGPAAVNRQIIV
jgi:hypothetical protein